MLTRFLLFALLLPLAACISPDQNEGCAGWAEMGECDSVSQL
jgi:hypothetical protein